MVLGVTHLPGKVKRKEPIGQGLSQAWVGVLLLNGLPGEQAQAQRTLPPLGNVQPTCAPFGAASKSFTLVATCTECRHGALEEKGLEVMRSYPCQLRGEERAQGDRKSVV